MVAMRREDGTYATPQVKKPVKAQASSQPNWMWPVAVTVVSLAAIGVGGFLYFARLESSAVKVAVPEQQCEPGIGVVRCLGISARCACDNGRANTVACNQDCGIRTSTFIADGGFGRKVCR